jgi:hypothetical protein
MLFKVQVELKLSYLIAKLNVQAQLKQPNISKVTRPICHILTVITALTN